jgi:hypothetical protein
MDEKNVDGGAREDEDAPEPSDEMLAEHGTPQKHLCGTFGCTLPNNHSGLHRLPENDGRARKRTKPLDIDTFWTGAGGQSSSSAGAAAGPSQHRPPKEPRAFKERAYRKEDSPEPRSIEHVRGLCKKTAFCQRFKNHPGARAWASVVSSRLSGFPPFRPRPPPKPRALQRASPHRSSGNESASTKRISTELPEHSLATFPSTPCVGILSVCRSVCACPQAYVRRRPHATRPSGARSRSDTAARAASRPCATRTRAVAARVVTRGSVAS